MGRLAFVSCAVLAVSIACAKSEMKTTDTGMAASMTPRTVTLADFAGTWEMKTWNEARDSVIVTSELMATADTNSWMQHLPGRSPMPVKILSVGGDSVVTEVGPYESILRKGVQVKTTNVLHLQDGKLVGMITARYSVNTADSVRSLPVEGTKKM
jgi:hypothetical protein